MQASRTPHASTSAPTRAPLRATAPPPPSPLRVTGTLTEDARLYPTAGAKGHPGQLLFLNFAPAQGLPYRARVDLGTDIADHMEAEALLPHLRRGAVVSAAASALQLRNDHDRQVLVLIDPRDVLVLEGPVATPTPTLPADLFTTNPRA